MSISKQIYKVSGVALGDGDVTVGQSKVKKKWTTEALRGAAESLSGKNLVRNHVNDDVDAVVGSVTEAWFERGKGVVFKGELDDEELAEKIERGRLDVSPRIRHEHMDELEENDNGALVVTEIKEFLNLAIVPRGAAKSNKIVPGHDTENLSQFIGLENVDNIGDLDILGSESSVEISEEQIGTGKIVDQIEVL